jgi:hypothetical protein
MRNKNAHVAMEKHICIATGKEYETGSLLLATRYHQNGESVVDLEGTNKRTGFNNNITGSGFCPEVQEKLDDGYVVLVVIDSSKSGIGENRSTVQPDEPYRTGEIIYMKKDVSGNFFDKEVGTMAFIDEEVAKLIKERIPNE